MNLSKSSTKKFGISLPISTNNKPLALQGVYSLDKALSRTNEKVQVLKSIAG